jgi:hypothetical protein
MASASAEGRRPLASEFLLTPPCSKSQTIPDNNYRILVKMRLGLDITPHGEQCRTRSYNRERPCTTRLTTHADHAFACAKAARQATHDGMADLNALFHREAGHRAWRETTVPEAKPTKKQQPIRADVLVRRGPTDPVECAEIKVRHFCHTNGDLRKPQQWDTFLAGEEDAVKRKYQPVRVRPWVFSTLGRPGEQFCFDIRRLARERLQQWDARQTVSRESLRQMLLRRWRTELSCTLAIGVSNTVLEALEGTAVQQLAPPRSGAFYDLQMNRFTGY